MSHIYLWLIEDIIVKNNCRKHFINKSSAITYIHIQMVKSEEFKSLQARLRFCEDSPRFELRAAHCHSSSIEHIKVFPFCAIVKLEEEKKKKTLPERSDTRK